MRLQTLDLLRFIAALAVVLYHYTAQPNSSFPALAQITQFGYLGVPLFFMISGFVIAASAERRSPIAFLISRAARLYPAFWIGVLFTSLVLLALSNKSPSLPQLLSNLTMLNNYLGIANIDGVYWTLQIELKFYGCIFLLMVLRLFHRYNFWLPVWLAMTLAYLVTGEPAKMGWVINPGYSCYFISGICLYLLWSQKHNIVTNITLAFASLLCLYQTYHQASGFMSASASNDWLIASAIVGLFHLIFILIAKNKLHLPESGIYNLLGGLTYPLYLLHNSAGKIFIEQLQKIISESAAILITMLIMFGLSYIIYRWLEPKGAKTVKHGLEQLLRIRRPGCTNTDQNSR